MVGSNRHSGARTRRNRGCAVAPIARAIRVALAVSAATLALSAPVAAAPFDLTRVEDAPPPASVVQADGAGLAIAIGLDAYGDYVRIDNNEGIDAVAAAGADYVAAVGVRAFGQDDLGLLQHAGLRGGAGAQAQMGQRRTAQIGLNH